MALVWCFITTVFLIATSQGQDTTTQVRLVNGITTREGRVEVLHDGVWGTICADGWTAADAVVVCTMLNYVGLARPYNDSFFGPGTGTIWMSQVACIGTETNIGNCPFLGGWGNAGSCTHSNDAGVTCLGNYVSTSTINLPTPSTTTPPPKICNTPRTDVQLVNGPNPAIGQVLIQYNGVWGGVCNNGWGTTNAQVICRSLCYNPVNARARFGSDFGNMTNPFLLDNVQCAGNEAYIGDCPHLPWNTTTCSPAKSAGVSCAADLPPGIVVPIPAIDCQNEMITATFLRSDDPALLDRYLTPNNQSANCGYTTSMDATYVTIHIPFTGCNTTKDTNQSFITYTNVVRYDVPANTTLITRQQVFFIPVACVLNRTKGAGSDIEPVTQTVPPQTGNGVFVVSMLLYPDSSFQNPIGQLPVRITLGSFVYVGIVLTSTDNTLKIIVPECWATPGIAADSTPQYYFFHNGCQQESTLTFYPISATMFGFGFQTFKFLQSPSVYLHCNAVICDVNENTPQCSQACGMTVAGRRRKRRRDVMIGDDASDVVIGDGESDAPKAVYRVFQGPLHFVETIDSQLALPDTFTPTKQSLDNNDWPSSLNGASSVFGLFGGYSKTIILHATIQLIFLGPYRTACI